MKVSLMLAASAVAFASHTGIAATPSCLNPVGDWQNQIKPKPSTLTISSVDWRTGAVSGSYLSPSGTAGQGVLLVGWVNKAASTPPPKKDVAVAIAFSVQWGAYETITSWTGYCHNDPDTGVPTIVTMWHLARPVTRYEWSHVLAGSDRFTPK
jgi:hypothetical protein